MSFVMVIDDERDLCALLVNVLNDAGYPAVGQHSVRCAERFIAQRKPVDLIISDVFMPGQDGFELLRRVRRWENRVPVVLMTGEALPHFDTLRFGRQLGAAAVLAKPFSAARLIEIVDATLAQSAGSVYSEVRV